MTSTWNPFKSIFTDASQFPFKNWISYRNDYQYCNSEIPLIYELEFNTNAHNTKVLYVTWVQHNNIKEQ